MASIPATKAPQAAIAAAIEQVADSLRTLRFGQIALTVHDGQVVQIDVTHKTRFRAGN